MVLCLSGKDCASPEPSLGFSVSWKPATQNEIHLERKLGIILREYERHTTKNPELRRRDYASDWTRVALGKGGGEEPQTHFPAFRDGRGVPHREDLPNSGVGQLWLPEFLCPQAGRVDGSKSLVFSLNQRVINLGWYL